MNFGHPLSELVDGDVNRGNGLDMARAQFEEQSIVFATDAPVSAQIFQFTTWHVSREKGAYPAAMELAVTSDDRPTRDGNWKPLKASMVMTDTFPRNPESVRAVDDMIFMAPFRAGGHGSHQRPAGDRPQPERELRDQRIPDPA